MRSERPKLSAEELSRLYARDDLRCLLRCACVFAAPPLLLLAHARLDTAWSLVLAFVLIAGLQHHLSIVQHEANHRLLFTNRTLNELVGWLAALPIGFTMAYRTQHLGHHQTLGMDEDPDLANYLEYPMTSAGFAKDVLLHLSGLAALRQFHAQSRGQPRERGSAAGAAAVALTQGALLAGFWLAGRFEDYFLLWLLPLVTLTKTITHFRNVAEHTIVRPREDPELARCRTILTGPIEGFFFAPMNFNYHAEHHFYPAIPYFNLPRAQRILSAQKEYKGAVDLERGYLRFLLTKAVARPQAA